MLEGGEQYYFRCLPPAICVPARCFAANGKAHLTRYSVHPAGILVAAVLGLLLSVVVNQDGDELLWS